MESVKMRHSLDVIQEQRIAVKDRSEKERKTDKGVDQTRKKKSHNLRFKNSSNGTNPTDKEQHVHHKQQLPHPIDERRFRIHKTEGHCWKLEYKPYDKHDELEKLKQEIYEKNIKRELELQIKSRTGSIRSGDLKSASMMPRIGPDITSMSYFKKREAVPIAKDLHWVVHAQDKDIEQSARALAPEMKDTRVKSSTRVRANTIPRNKNRVTGVTVGGLPTNTDSGLPHEGEKGVTTVLAHLENREIHETKTPPHIYSVETSKDDEKSSAQSHIYTGHHASTSAWVAHRYPSDTKLPTNEILEKYFSSNIFPPLSAKTKHEDKEHGRGVEMCTSPVKCWTAPDQETPTQSKPEDILTKKDMAAWKKESNELRRKIKEFIEKPVPEIPPSSLLIHRRSTVADISMSGFSKAGSTTAHAPGLERKKSLGVVNIHTCPNVNVFTDRSWMYQDRRSEKCRYIRAPQTPIPPISEVFHPNENE